MDDNRIKTHEVKENEKRYNSVKRAAHIIKKGNSYDNTISDVANLYYTDSILKDTPSPP